MVIFHFILAFISGQALALAFGYWHWSKYKRAPIYRREKIYYWVLKFVCVVALAYLLPGIAFDNALVIGFVLWFMFDCFMGYKIHGDFKATGTENWLDTLAHSSAWYFWFKFFLIISSIIWYFI